MHNAENKGSKPRDHDHKKDFSWRHVHRDWRLWVVVVVMLALILVYVFTDNFSLRPGKVPSQPMPAAGAP